VLNFTVQKLVSHGDNKLVFGKLETILDSPPVIVNEKVVPGIYKFYKKLTLLHDFAA